MATTSPPDTTAPVQPAPIVVSTPVQPVAPPTSGAKTSEGLITLFVQLLAASLANPWVTSISPLYKALMVIAAALSALGYGAMRTSIKNTHAVLTTAARLGQMPHTASVGVISRRISAFALVAILGLGGVGYVAGCGATSVSAVESGLGSAGSGFVNCEKVDLNADVGTTGLTVLATIAKDLIGTDWESAVAAAIDFFGGQTVACAVIAINDYENAVSAGSGSATVGVATSSGVSASELRRSRAAATIAKYRWKKAPKQAKSTASSATGRAAHETVGMDGSTWRKQHAGSAAIAQGSATP